MAMTTGACAPTSTDNRLYPSRPALEAAFDVVKKAKIPPIPDIVLALKKELDRPDPNMQKASELIGQDIAITGKLLKTINSPAFGLSAKVGSVQQAVSIMGLRRLANMVTAEAIDRMLADQGGEAKVVWDSILEEARVMVEIARLSRGVTPDEAYLFGMMHDVGCLVFTGLFESYSTEFILHRHTDTEELIDFEMKHLGVDHPTVSFLLAGNWKLPDQMALAIYLHHRVECAEVDDPKVRALVALANLAHRLDAFSEGSLDMSEICSEEEAIWRELKIADDDWVRLCESVAQGGSAA
ncbi:HDOD domain-containing protein [Thiorhodococcus drewsii]|nr:HDOD domain-containing protein [Thiorhodococcus drewsii]